MLSYVGVCMEMEGKFIIHLIIDLGEHLIIAVRQWPSLGSQMYLLRQPAAV